VLAEQPLGERDREDLDRRLIEDAGLLAHERVVRTVAHTETAADTGTLKQLLIDRRARRANRGCRQGTRLPLIDGERGGAQPHPHERAQTVDQPAPPRWIVPLGSTLTACHGPVASQLIAIVGISQGRAAAH
jgi:hypothetical protein